MEDIKVAREVVKMTAGEIGMTKNDYMKANDLLQKYGDERNRLFDELLSLLGKSDTSGLASDWKSRCEKGQSLLESLNKEIPTSPNGEGLNGVGAQYFHEGEKRIWEGNGKGQIALVAEVISKILDANLALIKKCDEDLKTVREGDKVVEALIQQNFGTLKSNLQELLKTIVIKAVPAVFNIWVKDRTSKDVVSSWGQFTAERMNENLKAAREKKALKKQILENLELLNKAKEQLDEKWIDDMYRQGEDCAKSLASVGCNGNYNAVDWAKFGDSCIRSLAERRDRAKEQSKKVFGELLPTFMEENNRAFAALTDDPSQVASWKSNMQDDFKSIDEALAKGDEIINDLAEGSFKQAARETFEEIRNMITSGAMLVFEKTKEAEDEIRS